MTVDRSDRDLVLAFQAGDLDAYDELYRRHRDRVARVCYRFLNSPSDAEEAAQETFLKAFQALPRFNGQYQVGAWLARIASNVCVDHLRVKSRTHLVALPSEDRVVLLDKGPEDILVGEYPRLDAAIQDVQPLHANALKMRAVEGMSHVEIAGKLDMTPPQVKALLHRARSSLRKAWDKAQGWLLLPLVKTRSVDKSSQMSNASSNLTVISAQAPALAEKAAASVLIVMVALTGPATVPSVRSNVGAGVADSTTETELDREERLAPPAALAETSAPEIAPQEVGTVAEVEITTALPETLTSTIEGREELEQDEDDDGDMTSRGENELVPPTVKESPNELRETAKETLENLVDQN